MSFTAEGGAGYSISVYLPPGYPDERPLLQVSPAVQHPWVDAAQQVVAAPGIVNVSTDGGVGCVVVGYYMVPLAIYETHNEYIVRMASRMHCICCRL